MNVYDDHKAWDKAIPAPDFNVAAFQAQIDRITGTVRGQPILMLRWTWDCHQTYFKGTWAEEEVWEYAVAWRNGNPVIPPRWVLHQRYEVGQYRDSWEVTRYIQNPEIGEIMDRGEPPPEWYKHLATLTIHNDFCCHYAMNQDKAKCHGVRYRKPDDQDLDELRKQRREHDILPSMNPHEPLSDAEVQAAFAAANGREKEKQAKLATYRKARWAEFMKDFGFKAPGQGREKKRNYSFDQLPTGFETAPSGLIIPKG